MAFGPVSVYGLADGDAIEVLCLDDQITGQQDIMRSFDLVIVGWCRCSVIEPDSITAHLRR